MNGQRIGYVRVSSADQSPELHLDDLNIDRTFAVTLSYSTRQNRWSKTRLLDASQTSGYSYPKHYYEFCFTGRPAPKRTVEAAIALKHPRRVSNTGR